jgi:hypothetical protein
VNPNFKGRPQIPTMGNHQQPKEIQYGNTGKQNMTAEERAREELLDKKRKEAAESLRRRQEVLYKETHGFIRFNNNNIL